ncbi:MAG: hypothetical protein AAF441_03960 [Pseudomonadota bacterium]
MNCARKLILLLPAAALLFLAAQSAPALAWEHSEAEEDWGPTCIARQGHRTGSIDIISSKGTFNPSLLISLPKYPGKTQDITVLLRVDRGNNIRVAGAINDYFGNIELKMSRDQLDSMIKGKRLHLAIEGGPTVTATLKGSSAALRAFLRCAGAG